jgi:hypothetical protein
VSQRLDCCKTGTVPKWLLISLVAGVCAITEAARPDDEAARNAVVQWLQLVDAGRYEEAAAQGSQEVRAFEQWVNQFKTQRASLGRVHNRQFAEIKHTAIVSGVPDVRRYCVVRFKTSFEHPLSVRAGLALNSGVASKPSATEEIVLTKIGCCWEIFGYTISDR